MSTNVMVRDLGIASPHRSDLRRLEVVAEGLTLFVGCQLAIDATVASPLHSDGTHGRRAAAIDGQEIDGEDIPRVVPAGRARAIGGGRWRGRGKIVPRNEGVVVVAGMREGCFTSAKVVWQRTSSVVHTVELSFGVLNS